MSRPLRAASRGGRASAEPGFGPSARVSLSADRAIEAQSQRPGEGLYGPDGRFVETSHRRDIARERREEPERQPERRADKSEDEHAARESEERPPRDLSLAEVDAAIPPAEREELRELADRASRDGDDGLTARDYKRLARLMERVGRYTEALRALERARELEEALAGEG